MLTSWKKQENNDISVCQTLSNLKLKEPFSSHLFNEGKRIYSLVLDVCSQLLTAVVCTDMVTALKWCLFYFRPD